MKPRASLDPILAPRSIAVVGVSREPGGVGRAIYDNLVQGGFQGRVYPINRAAPTIAGARAYPDVLALPEAPDLAVLAVPADRVLATVDQCGRRGVGGLVIITAGFRETGEAGAKREEALKELLAHHGLRAVGPNCMGVANTALAMNATFSPAKVRRGRVALVSQSGALGMAVLELAERLGLGLSHFVSLGNKADVSTNDLLERWEHDPEVGVILLYLENFGNPRRFVELARRIAATKPILAVKSGRTAAGAQAARSHTGTLAERDVLTEALFEQCGVVRAQTVGELFDLGVLFARAPLPRGRRVAVVTNSGGPGILATDALLERGLDLARLSPATLAAVRSALPPEASVGNPVDTTAGGGPDAFRAAVEAVLRDDGVDAVLVIYTPPAFLDDAAVMTAIAAPDRRGKPLLACVFGRGAENAAVHRLAEAGVPTFTFPESAARALAAAVAVAERRARPAGRVPTFAEVDRAAVAALLARAGPDGWLAPEDALALVRAAGIPTAATVRVASATAAVEAARDLGGRVVLKAVVRGLQHKTDVGGVVLDVAPADAAAAYDALAHRVAAKGLVLEGVLVQTMAPRGREVILGHAADPKFGPLLMFGSGGVYVEVLRDVVFRLAPLTDEDARRMVRALRGWPLLEGVRGDPPADVAAAEQALLRLSALVTAEEALAEIDINPFILGPAGQGGVAVDARVRVWPTGAAPRAPGVVPEVHHRLPSPA